MTLDPKVWQGGFTAGARGELPAACPHAVGTVEGWSWSSGYVEGKAERASHARQTVLKMRKA